jgi:hypothetical protein
MKRVSYATRTVLISFIAFSFMNCMSCGAGDSSPAFSSPETHMDNMSVQVKEVFAWEPVSSQKFLPSVYPLSSAIGSTLSIQACRGEFEPASFVIRANKNLAGIKISATNLIGAGGRSIASSAVDIYLVKCWYQAGEGTIHNQKRSVLLPELLLKDDTLVRVDTDQRKNYLKVNLNGTEQYIDISSPEAVFPENAEVKDATSLQPFDLGSGEEKQVWVSFHVPEGTPSGDYMGQILLEVPAERRRSLNLKVSVLPFDLPQPVIEYSIYYRGKLFNTAKKGINSEWKTPEQYRIELMDMTSHGVMSPSIYQPLEEILVNKALTIRKQVGIRTDSLYVHGTSTGNPSDATGLESLAAKVRTWLNLAAIHGYKDVYIYGIDEAKEDRLVSQRPAWREVRKTGAKVFVACDLGAAELMGDLMELPVLLGAFNPDEVEKWHSLGKRVFIYGNPLAGVEDPDIYRRNYGLELWYAGYDGVMDYAYQHSFGHIWNDFDHATYRDHVFVYPTSNGIIKTIQWEGFREAVDDVRYLTALLSKQDKTVVRQWLGHVLSGNPAAGNARKRIAERIIAASGNN